jgi:hypothetical protein
MIDRETLKGFHAWFDGYVRGFLFPDPALQKNIRVKIEHSKKVCTEIAVLGRSLGMDEPGLHFAETAALFHDVGRFEQLARYMTFSDHHSINHAELGISVLKSEGVLDRLPESDRDGLCGVIRNHNRFAIPRSESGFTLTMSRLLRDADKLDIYRILIDYYRNDGGEDNTVALGLRDIREISPEVMEDLSAGRLVLSEHLRTIDDFKLMKMGWVYDLNFPASFAAVRNRKYLEAIRDMLPDSDEVRRAYERVRSHLDAKCGMPSVSGIEMIAQSAS